MAIRKRLVNQRTTRSAVLQSLTSSSFYGTGMFISVFKTACHLLLSHTIPAQFLPAYLFKIHIYTIYAHNPGSSKWSLSFKFHHLNSLCTSTLPIGDTCTAHLVLLDLATRILGEEFPDSRRETTKFSRKTLPFCWLTTSCSSQFSCLITLQLNNIKFQFPLCVILSSLVLYYFSLAHFLAVSIFSLKTVIVQSTDHDAGKSAGGKARQPVGQPPTTPPHHSFRFGQFI